MLSLLGTAVYGDSNPTPLDKLGLKQCEALRALDQSLRESYGAFEEDVISPKALQVCNTLDSARADCLSSIEKLNEALNEKNPADFKEMSKWHKNTPWPILAGEFYSYIQSEYHDNINDRIRSTDEWVSSIDDCIRGQLPKNGGVLDDIRALSSLDKQAQFIDSYHSDLKVSLLMMQSHLSGKGVESLYNEHCLAGPETISPQKDSTPNPSLGRIDSRPIIIKTKKKTKSIAMDPPRPFNGEPVKTKTT